MPAPAAQSRAEPPDPQDARRPDGRSMRLHVGCPVAPKNWCHLPWNSTGGRASGDELASANRSSATNTCLPDCRVVQCRGEGSRPHRRFRSLRVCESVIPIRAVLH
jgi:hypothetical protein